MRAGGFLPSCLCRRLPSLIVWSLALASFAENATAQVTPADSLRETYRLPVPTAEQVEGLISAPSSGVAPGLGRAIVGDYLNVFFGAAYTRYTRYNRGDHDGQGIIGLGAGNPWTWLGLQADLMLYSTVRSGFFKRMGLNVEVYRYLFWDLILSLGWENFLTRGTPDTGESRYGTLAKWISFRDPDDWFSTLGLSAGMGDGRFVSEEDWLAGETDHFNLFGTLALQLARPVAFVASWQGDDLYLGTTITPFTDIPLFVTPGVADVLGRISSGPRFVVSGGYLLRLRLR